MSRYLFYPGCAMEASGRSYAESIAAVAAKLDLALDEIPDWNCCGATEYVGVAVTPAYALIARNLAIAAGQKQNGEPLVAACSACYLNLVKADHYMAERKSLNEQVNTALAAGGLSYAPGSVQVRHLLDIVMNDIGLDRVKEQVTKPLTGLAVAPYLGCMLPRPDPANRYTSHEHTDDLDRLLAALGATVIDYPLKTECCGGHMTQVAPKVGLGLIERLVGEAARLGADAMVTVCPMCQINIDAYQGEMNAMFQTHHKMPILFFTELMALAFGVDPKTAGVGREYTDVRPALAKIGTQPAAEAEPAAGPAHRPRPDKRALPMPRMADSEVKR